MIGFGAGFEDALGARETGLGETGGCGGLGERTCFWSRAEVVRETGSALEESTGFNAPEKAIGEMGLGDLISGFGFWRATGAGDGDGDGDGERYLAWAGDF